MKLQRSDSFTPVAGHDNVRMIEDSEMNQH